MKIGCVIAKCELCELSHVCKCRVCDFVIAGEVKSVNGFQRMEFCQHGVRNVTFVGTVFEQKLVGYFVPLMRDASQGQ